ncbi:uncharacterized protein LOC115629190 [Scaptodrosophila lebanonensis]|uniref:Uncharacterized protein LOC115629190 n=1 Tax=Drosophila lebanonensis TaxID=7225 RepID=A0A6J2U0M7_DROLE|nr:uncharacterized protein LOC115629190 [Scaptodrosophila lebanonensis]
MDNFFAYILVLWLSLQHFRSEALPGPFYLPPSSNTNHNSGNQDGAIITKQFYTISAPEEPLDSQSNTKHLLIGRPTRNYRVIFIRAPSSENAQLKYTAELAPQEERTVIYVLTRKQKELDAEDIVAPTQNQQLQKPEVFFIKYKTNEEAVAAQREIQSQYDELGGNSEHAAPFVAPVQSVIGALDNGNAVVANNVNNSAGYENHKTNAGYYYQKPAPLTPLLPPSFGRSF